MRVDLAATPGELDDDENVASLAVGRPRALGRNPLRAGQALVAVLAVASVVGDHGWAVWTAGAPWVDEVYQSARLCVSELGLVILSIVALAGAMKAGRVVGSWRSSLVVVAAAGLALLAAMAASALAASEPLLTVARVGDVALGLLVCLAVANRPNLARWLRVGFLLMLVVQLPFVVLQEATQSTFPAHTILAGRSVETPATAPGANAVTGGNGTYWQRAMGTFPHANVLGGFVALALTLALPLLSTRRPLSWVILGAWGIGWIELVLSFSRAATLAAVVGCGIWLILRGTLPRLVGHRARLLAAAALLLIASVAVLSRPLLLGAADNVNEPAVAQRILLGNVAADVIRSHPLVGIGAGNFELFELQPPYNAVMVDPVHVVPLLVAAEAGVPAGALWLLLVVGSPLLALRARGKLTADIRNRLAVVAAILVLALLDHYLWTLAPGRAMFWLALGAGVVR